MKSATTAATQRKRNFEYVPFSAFQTSEQRITSNEEKLHNKR